MQIIQARELTNILVSLSLGPDPNVFVTGACDSTAKV